MRLMGGLRTLTGPPLGQQSFSGIRDSRRMLVQRASFEPVMMASQDEPYRLLVRGEEQGRAS